MNITDILILGMYGVSSIIIVLVMCYVSFKAGYIKAVGDMVTGVLTKREKEGK